MRTFLKPVYSVFVILSLAIAGCSEETIDDNGTGTITGTIVEEGTNAPLQNVKVSTNPNSSTVFSDAEGKFTLSDVPVGDYAVEASLDEFITAFEAATVTNDNTVSVVFELEPQTADNRPPLSVTLLTPAEGSVDQPTTLDLIWSAEDADADDVLTYQVRLLNSDNDEELVFENVVDTTLTVTNLQFGAKYFWQVSANDGVNSQSTNSELSSFTIISQADANDTRLLYVRKIGDNNVIFLQSAEEGVADFQLTSAATNSFRPRRNNEAQRIAFMRSVGGQVHLFTMDFEGDNVQQVTTSIGLNGFNFSELDFSWNPSGTALIYPNFDKLYTVGLNGGSPELLYQTTDGSLISEVHQNSIDGRYVIKTNNIDGYDAHIFVLDSSFSLVADVVSGFGGAHGGIDMSIDGNLVLYTRDVQEFESTTEYRPLNSRLFIYNISLNTTEDFSGDKPDGFNDLDCRFSPNQAQIYFMNTNNDNLSQRDIYTIFIDEEDNNNRILVLEDGFMPDFE